MSSRIKKIKSNYFFPKVRLIYISIFFLYLLYLFIIFLTNGSLEYTLKENIIYLLFPLAIPIFFSFLGVYNFSLEDNNGLLEFNNQCMLLGSVNSEFRNHLIIPTHNITDFKLNSSFFGLKKNLSVKFKGNQKKYKKTFNISLLSKKETKTLLDHLLNKTTNHKHA